jgi:hypothetical protein
MTSLELLTSYKTGRRSKLLYAFSGVLHAGPSAGDIGPTCVRSRRAPICRALRRAYTDSGCIVFHFPASPSALPAA